MNMRQIKEPQAFGWNCRWFNNPAFFVMTATFILLMGMPLLTDRDQQSRMSGAENFIGDGHAAEKKVEVLEEGPNTHKRNQADVGVLQSQQPDIYDLVVVLTVWKRETVDEILKMVRRQTALNGVQVALIVFQNGAHVDVSASVAQWAKSTSWDGNKVDVLHIENVVETGYYGRFLSPFAVSSNSDAKFIILDDDIIFGSRYFENMLRVVDGGSLATRNGRFLGEELREFDWRDGWNEGDVDSFDRDDEYDFGGHIWAGKMSWLRTLWQNPPPLYYNAEDFWISAVLKVKLGVTTKRPRCPSPSSGGDVELCACSMKIAINHVAATVGEHSVNEQKQTRADAMQTIHDHYGFVTILSENPAATSSMGLAHTEIPMEQFSPTQESKEMFERCLFWY